MNSFREWLESNALLVPKTGQGGGGGTTNDEGDDGEGGDEWDRERLEMYRWNILKWCRETESMRKIVQAAGEMVAAAKATRTTYMINTSRYPPPRYLLQLRYEFEVDMSPLADRIRGTLERSDLWKPLKIDQGSLYRLLENDEAREYVAEIICLYLSSKQEGSPFTQSHFGLKEQSPLSNHFSFAVWDRLKRGWEKRILPQLSDAAIHARDRVERPKDWTKVGKPEVRAELSNSKIASSVTVYSPESNSTLSAVIVLIPFDWNEG